MNLRGLLSGNMKMFGIHQGFGPFGYSLTGSECLNQLFSFCIGSLILEPYIDFLNREANSPHPLSLLI